MLDRLHDLIKKQFHKRQRLLLRREVGLRRRQAADSPHLPFPIFQGNQECLSISAFTSKYNRSSLLSKLRGKLSIGIL